MLEAATTPPRARGRAVYRYVGLGLLCRAWLNLDLLWALLLILVGAIVLAAATR